MFKVTVDVGTAAEIISALTSIAHTPIGPLITEGYHPDLGKVVITDTADGFLLISEEPLSRAGSQREQLAELQRMVARAHASGHQADPGPLTIEGEAA